MDKEMGGHDDEPHVPKNLRKFLEHHEENKKEKEEEEEPLLPNDMT